MKFPFQQTVRGERGYILLTLMLFVALLTIGLMALVQNIEQQIKRDREEELIHRGVQYSRAVQHYFKKFGRYPTKIEDLENTNNIRFLRKRYKDPVTGKDFKLLHVTDVQMAFSIGTAGGAGLPAAALNPSTVGGGNGPAAGPVVQDPNAAQDQQAGDTNGGSDPNGPSGAGPNGLNPGGAGPNGQPSGQPGSLIGSNQLTSQTFGGGPIVGVASTSKDKTIREFNKKDHYNQWQFIYDPTSDRGGLLMTPNQPPLVGIGGVNPAGGVNPQNGTQGPPGANPSFGPGQQPGPTNSPMQPNQQPPDQ